jgi:hypothetical protein
MKIALFQDIDSEFGPRIGDESQEREDGYMRVSGYLEIEFPPLEPEAVARQLAAIDSTKAFQQELFEEMWRRIEARRAALTEQSSSSRGM